MVFALTGCAAAFAVDQQLAADAKLAMKRADLSLDYVSRAIGHEDKPYSLSKLSDQLNGKTPFTAFWRFFVGDMRETAFREEFFAIQADRIGHAFIPNAQIAGLVSRLDFLLGTVPKPMLKADLPRTRSVSLPLGQKEAS